MELTQVPQNNNNNNLYVRKIMSVIIEQTETIPKSFGKYLSNREGRHEIEEI